MKVNPNTAGCKDRPFKLAIIGGGPSGCSIIVRAIRLGLLRDIAEGSDDNEAGLCLIDKGPREKFGGGRLQDYVINSNTYANKFATNVTEVSAIYSEICCDPSI